MFTTTNVAATAASAGGGGPVAAAVPPTFQIINQTIPGSSTSSSSSSSSSSTTTSTWRLTPASSSTIIKQPSVVSIINGNLNVTSTTSVPINSTGVTMPTSGTVYYIKKTNSQPFNPITTGNLIIQSPQTVRLVSAPLQTSLSTPTLTLLNNSNTTIINASKQILTTPSKKCYSYFSFINRIFFFIDSSSNNFKPGFCIDTPILGSLAPIIIQRQSKIYSENCFLEKYIYLYFSFRYNKFSFTTIPIIYYYNYCSKSK